MIMTEVPLGELGPVDYVIVEFPAEASSFTGEMATELSDIDELGELQTIEACGRHRSLQRHGAQAAS